MPDRKLTRVVIPLGIVIILLSLVYYQESTVRAASDVVNRVKGGTAGTNPDGTVRWSNVELGYRKFEWVEPSPDRTLLQQVQDLTSVRN